MVTVDTHIIIWEALDPDKLTKKARTPFERANDSDGILFCDISLWEIAMLLDKHRIEIDSSFLEFIDLLKKTRNYKFQSITPEISDISIKQISKTISDPADRIISATSIFSNTPLITADKNIRNLKNINSIW